MNDLAYYVRLIAQLLTLLIVLFGVNIAIQSCCNYLIINKLDELQQQVQQIRDITADEHETFLDEGLDESVFEMKSIPFLDYTLTGKKECSKP